MGDGWKRAREAAKATRKPATVFAVGEQVTLVRHDESEPNAEEVREIRKVAEVKRGRVIDDCGGDWKLDGSDPMRGDMRPFSIRATKPDDAAALNRRAYLGEILGVDPFAWGKLSTGDLRRVVALLRGTTPEDVS